MEKKFILQAQKFLASLSNQYYERYRKVPTLRVSDNHLAIQISFVGLPQPKVNWDIKRFLINL